MKNDSSVCPICGSKFKKRSYQHTFCTKKCKYKHRSNVRLQRYKTDPDYRTYEREYQKKWRNKKYREDSDFRKRCQISTMKYFAKKYKEYLRRSQEGI